MPKTSLVTNDDEQIMEKKRKKFDQSDGIPCRSVVQGSLYMEGAKTQMIYMWSDYGDVSEVEYRDLAAAVRSKSKYVYNPYFIIEDEDFLDEFPAVKKFYDDSHSVKELREILAMPVDRMEKTINSLPATVMDALKSLAAKQVATGQIDSVRKIKVLDKIFGTDLNLIGEIFSDNT